MTTAISRRFLVILVIAGLLFLLLYILPSAVAAGGPGGSCDPGRTNGGGTGTVSESEWIGLTNGSYWLSATTTIEVDTPLYVETENSKFFLKINGGTDAALTTLRGAFVKYEWDDAGTQTDEDIYAYVYNDDGVLFGSYHNENAEALGNNIVFRIEYFKSPLVAFYKVYVNGAQVLYVPADFWHFDQSAGSYYIHSGWKSNFGSQIFGRLGDIGSITNNLGGTNVGSTYVTAGHPPDYKAVFGSMAVTGVNNPYGWYLYDANCP